ncbi:hypothetical protein IT409_01040 [Candidatus Falkowbacteria bacterium]|nr:hypothetical protein [Candidatus Falkowbacteria bacterium]
MKSLEAMVKLIDSCNRAELEQIIQILSSRATSNVAIVVTEVIREELHERREWVIGYLKGRLDSFQA